MDLKQSAAASPLVQTVTTDPGRLWVRDADVAIDAPPDEDTAPAPDATWSPQATQTGLCGAVGPRVLALPSGDYRMYYSQILPQAGYPHGANDYDHSTTRILSAWSADGYRWTPEPGVRLSPQAVDDRTWRVVSSEVVPAGDAAKCSEMCVLRLPQSDRTTPRYRLFYEACDGTAENARGVWRIAAATSGGEAQH